MRESAYIALRLPPSSSPPETLCETAGTVAATTPQQSVAGSAEREDAAPDRSPYRETARGETRESRRTTTTLSAMRERGKSAAAAITGSAADRTEKEERSRRSSFALLVPRKRIPR